ncbi:hypothetical protein [Sinorhizobium fredii]|uniref:hypothetical protein n=1 Tax=Rhizobium fredii TaxID=380 RepID=UPI0035199CFA
MTTVIKRVSSGAITSNVTRRVPEVIGLGPFLLLEGDFSGALAFEAGPDEEAIEDGLEVDGYLRLQGSF